MTPLQRAAAAVFEHTLLHGDLIYVANPEVRPTRCTLALQWSFVQDNATGQEHASNDGLPRMTRLTFLHQSGPSSHVNVVDVTPMLPPGYLHTPEAEPLRNVMASLREASRLLTEPESSYHQDYMDYDADEFGGPYRVAEMRNRRSVLARRARSLSAREKDELKTLNEILYAAHAKCHRLAAEAKARGHQYRAMHMHWGATYDVPLKEEGNRLQKNLMQLYLEQFIRL